MEDILREYLIDKLKIHVSINTEFGPVETLTIKLEVDGEEICITSCDIPVQQYSSPTIGCQ